jgi:hypothetical protein
MFYNEKEVKYMTEEIIETAVENSEVVTTAGGKLLNILSNKKILIGAAVVSAGALVCTVGKKVWDKFHKKDVDIPQFTTEEETTVEESEEVEG